MRSPFDRDHKDVYPNRPTAEELQMTCEGFDAMACDIAMKIEHCMNKYGKTFEEVVARVKMFHEDWNEEIKVDVPIWHNEV